MTVVPAENQPMWKMHPRDLLGPDVPLPPEQLAVLADLHRTHRNLRLRNRRLAAQRATDDITGPTPERAAQSTVYRSEKPISDAQGKIGAPHICVDTLDRMERRGTITRKMHAAATRFREEFRVANLDPLRAMPIEGGVRGGNGGCISETAEGAREHVQAAMERLGGRQSPAGACIWHVVGMEMTLKDWAWVNGWGCKSVGGDAASGVLVGALCALTAHYGY